MGLGHSREAPEPVTFLKRLLNSINRWQRTNKIAGPLRQLGASVVTRTAR